LQLSFLQQIFRILSFLFSCSFSRCCRCCCLCFSWLAVFFFYNRIALSFTIKATYNASVVLSGE
jgi:hypothetical protein